MGAWKRLVYCNQLFSASRDEEYRNLQFDMAFASSKNCADLSEKPFFLHLVPVLMHDAVVPPAIPPPPHHCVEL